MLKKTLALSLTSLFCLPALAQSGIQLYGSVDASFQYGKEMGNKTAGIDGGGIGDSFLGLRGEEALGAGLEAVFVLEQGFDIDVGKSCCINETDSNANSGSDLFTQQAYVGLKGAFGQIALGRQHAPGHLSELYDALPDMAVSPQKRLAELANLTIVSEDLARWNNAIGYTGEFETLGVSAIYSAGNLETNQAHGISRTDDDKYGLGLYYENGPLKVGAIYHAVKYKAQYDGVWNKNPAGENETQKEWLLGATYDFGFATLAGSWQQGRDVLGVSGFDVHLWQIGLIIPVVGEDTLNLAYGQTKLDGGNAIMGDGGSVKPKSLGVAYLHPLSKRTTVYAAYTWIDHDDLHWNQATALGQDDNGHAGDSKVGDTNLFYLGLNHQF
ncbi:porin [Tepidiphilus baoligensis]|uniref:porin n=1 Tax=Tepidiphilus baoligensis TaxID=2698687 RepID=UPI0036182DD2